MNARSPRGSLAAWRPACLLVTLFFVAACGGFENRELRRDASPLADLSGSDTGREATNSDSLGPPHPCKEPRTLAIRDPELIEARVGAVMTIPLGLEAQPEGLVTWSVVEGTLPAGLRLEALSGYLSGRPEPESEGSYPLRVKVAPVGGATCWEPGTSTVFELQVDGPCDGSSGGCEEPTSCQDARCLLANAPCATQPAERLRVISPEKLRGLYTFHHARVVTNTRLLDEASGARQGLLQFSLGTSSTLRSLNYRLPGDLMLPLRTEQIVDIGLYLDASDSAGLTISDANQGFLFFGYDGPLAGDAFNAICKSMGGCPLQSLRNELTPCPPSPEPEGDAYVNTALLVQAQGMTVRVIQGAVEALWDDDRRTAPPGTALLYAPMVRQSLPPHGEPPQGPWRWHSFMVQAPNACPTPTIELTELSVETSRGQDQPLARFHFDGARSRSLATTIASWDWSLEAPPGSVAVLSSPESGAPSEVLLEADEVGVYSVSLEVTDAAGRKSCARDWLSVSVGD